MSHQLPTRVRESYSESHNGSEECSEDRFTDININRAISSSSIDSMGEREIERDSRVSPQMIPNPYNIYPSQVRVGGPPYMIPPHFYSNSICSCCAANYIYVHPTLPNPNSHQPPCQCSHNNTQPSSINVQPKAPTPTVNSAPQPPKKEAKQNAAKLPPVMNLTAAAAVDPRKFKTQLCRNWEKNGQCPYRSSCCFAHGQSELRDIPSNQSLMAYIGHVSNLLLMASGDAEKTKVLQSQLQQTMAMLSPASRPPNSNS